MKKSIDRVSLFQQEQSSSGDGERRVKKSLQALGAIHSIIVTGAMDTGKSRFLSQWFECLDLLVYDFCGEHLGEPNCNLFVWSAGLDQQQKAWGNYEWLKGRTTTVYDVATDSNVLEAYHNMMKTSEQRATILIFDDMANSPAMKNRRTGGSSIQQLWVELKNYHGYAGVVGHQLDQFPKSMRENSFARGLYPFNTDESLNKYYQTEWSESFIASSTANHNELRVKEDNTSRSKTDFQTVIGTVFSDSNMGKKKYPFILIKPYERHNTGKKAYYGFGDALSPKIRGNDFCLREHFVAGFGDNLKFAGTIVEPNAIDPLFPFFTLPHNIVNLMLRRIAYFKALIKEIGRKKALHKALNICSEC